MILATRPVYHRGPTLTTTASGRRHGETGWPPWPRRPRPGGGGAPGRRKRVRSVRHRVVGEDHPVRVALPLDPPQPVDGRGGEGVRHGLARPEADVRPRRRPGRRGRRRGSAAVPGSRRPAPARPPRRRCRAGTARRACRTRRRPGRSSASAPPRCRSCRPASGSIGSAAALRSAASSSPVSSSPPVALGIGSVGSPADRAELGRVEQAAWCRSMAPPIASNGLQQVARSLGRAEERARSP